MLLDRTPHIKSVEKTKDLADIRAEKRGYDNNKAIVLRVAMPVLLRVSTPEETTVEYGGFLVPPPQLGIKCVRLRTAEITTKGSRVHRQDFELWSEQLLPVLELAALPTDGWKVSTWFRIARGNKKEITGWLARIILRNDDVGPLPEGFSHA